MKFRARQGCLIDQVFQIFWVWINRVQLHKQLPCKWKYIFLNIIHLISDSKIQEEQVDSSLSKNQALIS